MHTHGTMIELEVNIYATNLASKPRMYSNEWRISETNLVATASVMCLHT